MDPFRKEYRELSDLDRAVMDAIKDAATSLHEAIGLVPNGREKALANTKLEEAVMWAVKGVTQ